MKSKLSKLRTIAESNPMTLLSKREFWSSQKEFIFTIVISVLIALLLVRFTYDKADLLTYVLNITIHSLAFWGVVASAKALAEIEVESAIVRFVEEMGADYLDHVGKNENASRKNLDSLSQEFVPNNQTQPPWGMIRQ